MGSGVRGATVNATELRRTFAIKTLRKVLKYLGAYRST